MAFSHGSKARVMVNAYDISPFTTSASFSGSLDTADVSVMGNTAKQYVTGLADATISLDGALDGTVGGSDDIISQAIAAGAGTDGVLYFPAGYGAVGQPAWGWDAFENSYQVTTGVGDAAKWSATFQSTSGFERGLLLHPYQAEVAGGNTASVDNSAASANGGVAYLMASAGASLLVKVQDSADNSAWADFAGAAFTVTSVRSYQRLVVAGTVRRYIRCLWTGTGTFAASFVRR